MARTDRQARALGVGSIAAFLLVGGLLVNSVLTSTDPAKPDRASLHALRPGGLPVRAGIDGPCAGPQGSLDEAVASSRFTMLVPDHPEAKEESITGVWRCADIEAVAMNFRSGVSVIVERWTHDRTPSQIEARIDTWAAQQRQTTGAARGSKALLISPSNGARGAVYVIENELLLRVAGNGSHSLDTLRAIMESMRARS